MPATKGLQNYFFAFTSKGKGASPNAPLNTPLGGGQVAHRTASYETVRRRRNLVDVDRVINH